MSVISSLLVAVGVDPAGVDKGLGQADSRIGKFAGGLSKTGAVMTTGLTLPLVGLGVAAFKSAMTVDEAYDRIQSGTGATGKKLEGLEKSFGRVASKTPADMGKVADTVTELNQRLDLTGPTLEKLSRQVLEAGRLSGVEVNVRAATAAFSAFHVQGKDTTSGMDDLFRVSQATGLGINDLTSIMAKSGGVLSQLGFNFKQSASLIGVLDKAGVNSRAVISSMSAGLVKLAKDGEKPADTFKRVTGHLQGLVDKGKDADALQLASKVFGTRGAGQFVAALKSGKVNLDDISKSAGLGGQSILGMANKTKDFPELWTQFKNKATLALAPLAADLLPKLATGLTMMADKLTALVKWWDGLSSGTQKFILVALGVVAVVGPILMMVGKAITVFQTLQQVITAFRSVWLALNILFAASPIGFIVVAVVALVAALVLAYQHCETFRNIVNNAFTVVKDVAGAALDWIVEKALAWGPYLLGALLGPVGLIAVGIIKHWDTIKSATGAAWNWVVDKVKAVPGLLMSAFLNFTLPGLIIKHWDQIKSGTTTAWNAVVDFVKAIPGKLLSFFLNWTLAGQVIKHWDEAKAGTVRVANAIVDWVAGIPGRIVSNLSALGGMLRDLGEHAFDNLRTAAVVRTTQLVTFVNNIPGRVKSALGDLGGLLLNAGKAIIQGLIDGISSKIDDVEGMLHNLTDKIPDWKGPAGKDKVLLQPAGRMIIDGLIKGLNGGRSDVKATLEKVAKLIEDTMSKRFKDNKVAAAATRAAMAGISGEAAALLNNAKARERVAAKLDSARDRLKEAIQQSRDYAHSVRDSIVAFGNITQFADQETGLVTAHDVIDGLRKKVAAAKEYAAVMEQLANMGLNKTALDQLKEAGVEGGMATAEALMVGGQSAIDTVNNLTDQLTQTGAGLGNSLADTMYGSGIDAAQALVDSLESKSEALAKTGRHLAQEFMDALRHELGIQGAGKYGIDVDGVYTKAHAHTGKPKGGVMSDGGGTKSDADALAEAVRKGNEQLVSTIEKLPRDYRLGERKS